MSVTFVDLKKEKKKSQATDLTGVIHLEALLIFQYELLFSGFTSNGNNIAGHCWRYLFTPIHSPLISNSNYENCHKTFPTIPVPFLFCNKNIE